MMVDSQKTGIKITGQARRAGNCSLYKLGCEAGKVCRVDGKMCMTNR
jgi:hypothetical protein